MPSRHPLGQYPFHIYKSSLAFDNWNWNVSSSAFISHLARASSFLFSDNPTKKEPPPPPNRTSVHPPKNRATKRNFYFDGKGREYIWRNVPLLFSWIIHRNYAILVWFGRASDLRTRKIILEKGQLCNLISWLLFNANLMKTYRES